MDHEGLHRRALEVMRCNACFEAGEVKRSFVDLPQPRYIGPRYAASSPRIAWLMINPGEGEEDPDNRSWRAVLTQYRGGEATLEEVFQVQRRFMPTWNELMPFIAKHGLSVDRLALVNVAWCATVKNKYPGSMLTRCWTMHTAGWLKELAPEVVILSGTATYRFGAQMEQQLPGVRVLETFHYAHRGPDRARANARAVEIRKQLGL